MDPTLVVTLMGTAISALFGWLIKVYNDRLAELRDENRTLREKVDKQTEALLKNATSQEQVVEMLRTLLTDRGGA